MENTPGLSFFWNTVKSLLQGKVLYAPDTPAARLIVKEVRSGKRLKVWGNVKEINHLQHNCVQEINNNAAVEEGPGVHLC